MVGGSGADRTWRGPAPLALVAVCLAGILLALLLAAGRVLGDEPRGKPADGGVPRESLAFEHVSLAVVMKACALGSVCTASWRVDASGHVVHRDGERLFEATLPSEALASLAALAVSADIVSEVRRPEPCPDRTKVFSEIEIGFVPGLLVSTHTGDCSGQRLGALTGAIRRTAKALFPTSRSSDDVLPQILNGPPALGQLRPGGVKRPARPVRAQGAAKVALATSR